MQNLIYTFGTHIEIKQLEDDNTPKTYGTALLASEVKSLREQVASLLSATPQARWQRIRKSKRSRARAIRRSRWTRPR